MVLFVRRSVVFDMMGEAVEVELSLDNSSVKRKQTVLVFRDRTPYFGAIVEKVFRQVDCGLITGRDDLIV